ncbi:MAG: tRNA pseudouridine(55) synthase TruB [Alphaproteobacteria bacterium]|nr:tRNA pseudouridine(55) synthase TruB [Alphaproteobacteria bacterium]MCY4318251.1 tRNA pseudouridine(55) synthase TruB [Alphaproteobacteria bacterium]
MPRRRPKRVDLNGWIVVDKSAGMTSTTVCNRIKRLTGGAKIGHGGALDPLATGVLPVALGQATKTVSWVMEGSKVYRFTMRWGEARDTDDADGRVTATSAVRPDDDAIRNVLPAFTGQIMQVPPRYSAVKIGGKRAYDLARADKEPDLQARPAEVIALRLERRIDDDLTEFTAETGKGVYVRAIARDLAAALGTVGHVSMLRRLRVGPFRVEDAIALEEMEALAHIDSESVFLLPTDMSLADIPALSVSEQEAAALRNGQALRLFSAADLSRIAGLRDGMTIRARMGEVLIAVARYESGTVRPVRVVNP